MATSYTANAQLQKPAASDRNWDVPINANADAIDSLTAIGSLIVTAAEAPSASLRIRIAPGSFVRSDGTIGSFRGAPTLTVSASSMTCCWLTDAGVVVTGTAYPTTAHLRLGRVYTDVATVAQVVDDRIQCGVVGSGMGFVLKAGDTMTGTFTVASSTASTLVADPVNRLIGFFGTSAAGQAASLNPLTAAAGTASDSINDVGSSHDQGTLNNNFASLVAKVDAIIVALKRHGLMASS